MPRHMGPGTTRRRGRPLRRPVRFAAAAGLAAVLALGLLLAPRSAPRWLPGAAGADCALEPVDVAVSPELRAVVTQILRPLHGEVVGGRCLNPTVRSQEPQETAASADILPVDRAPQVWIPDAAVWAQKARRWPLVAVGSLASTPVVVATSTEAAQALGWAQQAPTWRQVLR